MKRKQIIPHCILMLLFFANTFLYHRANDIYSILCSSMYYVFLYTPIFLYRISEDVKETFNELLLLRVGKRCRNTCRYVGRIIRDSVIYSVEFTVLLVVVMYLANGMDDFRFGVFVLAVNLIGWCFIGCVYYFTFSFLNRVMAVLLTWGICVVMAFSDGVLFQMGKYIYNIFSVMILAENDTMESKAMQMITAAVISLFILCVTVVLQRRKDVIGRENV